MVSHTGLNCVYSTDRLGAELASRRDGNLLIMRMIRI